MDITEKVEDFVADAKAITWDTCHKIYVLMDDEQVAEMRGYGYEPIVTKAEATTEQMIEMLQEWYDESCGLRFINAVETNHENPNAGFTDLVPQFFEDEDEKTPMCAECGYHEVSDEGDTCRWCEESDEDEDTDEDK